MMTKFIKHLVYIQVIFLFVFNNAHSISDGVTQNDISNSEISLVIKRLNGRHMFIILTPTKEQTLANTNLPIWTADEYDSKNVSVRETELNALEIIGNFRTYHNNEMNSAVVLFERTQSFFGVIGSKYYIQGLPLDEINEVHIVGGKYVKRRNAKNESKTQYLPPWWNQTAFSSHDPVTKRRINPEQYLNNTQKLQTNNEKYYIETFVFVTWDITELYYGSDPISYLSTLVMDQIIFFNAVDMMYAKLQLDRIDIHINLAGIVIENAAHIFESILAYRYLYYDSSGVYSLPEDTIHDAFRRYLKTEHKPFRVDAMDLIIVMSGRRLLEDYDVIRGMTYPMDIYAMRQTEYHDEAIPMVAIQFRTFFDQYCVAAHEIGHSLQIFQPQIDFRERRYKIQCNGVNLHKSFSCFKCANSSHQRIEQSRKFMRNNKNRCFLLNYPRSLLRPSEAKTLVISPYDQCYCYGYYYVERTIPPDACARPLECRVNFDYSNYGKLITTILPADGTPCGIKKVCWRMECIDIYNISE